MIHVKRLFIEGLVVFLPIYITLYALYWLFRFLANMPLAETVASPLLRVILVILILIVITIAFGIGRRTRFGQAVGNTSERAIDRIWGIRTVYFGSKRLLELWLTESDDSLYTPSAVTFNVGDDPRVRVPAFVLPEATRSDEYVPLLVPIAPTFRSGIIVEVSPDIVNEAEGPTIETIARIRAVSEHADGLSAPSEATERDAR
jgi:uncharacterized membrane protein